MTAHAVDSTAGRRGGAAEIDAGVAGTIAAGRGPEEKLGERHGTAGDVAAEEVGVPFGESFGIADAAGENAVAEAWGKTLDLGFDDCGAVDDRAGGNVAVGPGGVLAFRSARRIEEAGLNDQDKGAVVEAAVEGVVLGLGDLGKGAA